MQLKKIIIILALWATSISVQAVAQSINEALAHCASIAVDTQRLQCFDKLVAKKQLVKKTHTPNKTTQSLAETKQEPTRATTTAVVTAEPVKIVAETATKTATASLAANFGLEHIKSKEVRQFDHVEFVVKSAKLSLRKKWRLTLENGQVWHATELVSGVKFKQGDVVVIKRGILNAFYIKKKGSKRSVRVKRIK